MNQASDAGSPVDRRDGAMDNVIGWVLLAGVLLSVALIVAGLAWRLVTSGTLGADHRLPGMNVAQFAGAEAKMALSGDLRPRLLVDAGILVLLLTPYARVLASVLFFSLRERNLKYTIITGLVLAILSYSLFAR